MSNVDPALLRDQRTTLANLLEMLRTQGADAETLEHLEGVLCLLDSIQDTLL